jgi:hypothetical protein
MLDASPNQPAPALSTSPSLWPSFSPFTLPLVSSARPLHLPAMRTRPAPLVLVPFLALAASSSAIPVSLATTTTSTPAPNQICECESIFFYLLVLSNRLFS